MTDSETDWVLLHRYVAGECTPDELVRVAEWVGGDPERQKLLAELEAMVKASAHLASEPDVARMWAAVRRPLTPPTPLSQGRGGRTTKSTIHGEPGGFAPWTPEKRRIGGLVAVASLAIVSVVVFRASHLGQGSWREYVTKAGQRESVTLSDGTRFTLAPASRLRVPIDYASGNRGVTLEGEAFFAVVHGAAHPFSVRVRNAVATDIGTQFDVRGYANDRDVRVAVAEGRVGIAAGLGTVCDRPCATASTMASRGATASTMASGGDLAIVRDTAVAITHGANVASLTAWRDGRIVFDSTSVGDVAAELTRWYGVSVAADPALRARTLTLTIEPMSLETALALVAPAVGARVDHVAGGYALKAVVGAEP